MSYPERIKQIAAKSHGSPPHEWLTEYLKLRGDHLLRELRSCRVDKFENIQGRLDENDKLIELIKAIEESKVE